MWKGAQESAFLFDCNQGLLPLVIPSLEGILRFTLLSDLVLARPDMTIAGTGTEMRSSKAGAVVERARVAEEALLIQFDKHAGNPTSVGEGIARLEVQTFPELVKFCILSGWSAHYRGGYIILKRGCGMGGRGAL